GDGIAVRNGNDYIQGGSTGNTGTFTFGCLQYTTPVQSNFVSFISELPEWNPVASFTYTISNDTTYTFSDQSTDAISWHWDFGDGDTSNAQNPSHDFTSGGSYTVVLTVYHGVCSSTDTLQIVGVGINEVNAANDFLIYPNPTPGKFTLRFSHKQKMVLTEIFSVLGEKLFSEELNSFTEKTIALNDLASGVYYVSINDGGNNYYRKLIIEHY